MKPRLDTCKARALPAVPSLWPLYDPFFPALVETRGCAMPQGGVPSIAGAPPLGLCPLLGYPGLSPHTTPSHLRDGATLRHILVPFLAQLSPRQCGQTPGVWPSPGKLAASRALHKWPNPQGTHGWLSLPLFSLKTADSKRLKAFLGISALPAAPRLLLASPEPQNLHKITCWAPSSVPGADRPGEGMPGTEGLVLRVPARAHHFCLPPQACSLLWWQECGITVTCRSQTCRSRGPALCWAGNWPTPVAILLLSLPSRPLLGSGSPRPLVSSSSEGPTFLLDR